MKKRWLRFVLLEDCSFTDLLTKIAKAFNVELSVEDDEGRYVAKGDFSFYSIELVDRFDRFLNALSLARRQTNRSSPSVSSGSKTTMTTSWRLLKVQWTALTGGARWTLRSAS